MLMQKEETNKQNPTDTSKIAYFGGYGRKSSYSNCEQRDFLVSLDRNTKEITAKDAELIAEKVQKDMLKEFKAVNGKIQTIDIEETMQIQVENGNRGYMVRGTVNGLPFLTMYSLVPLDGKELSDAATPDIMETFPLDKQELFKTIENWYGIAGIAYIQTNNELPIIDILWSSMSKYDE